eukprot:11194702-Lingulodinium_polyedra.AAC.1
MHWPKQFDTNERDDCRTAQTTPPPITARQQRGHRLPTDDTATLNVGKQSSHNGGCDVPIRTASSG